MTDPPEEPPPHVVYYAQQTEQKAVQAVIYAVLAYVFCPVVLAIVALRRARQAEESIDASDGRLTGGAWVTVAQALAWINITLALLWFFVLFMAWPSG